MNVHRYFRRYLGFFILTVLMLAGFNALVDPYLVVGAPRIEGFNDKKPTSANRTLLFKPYEVLRAKPNTLIAGNSRPEMGLNPSSSCWQEGHGKVYSLTLPGLDFYGQIRAIFHGMQAGDVKHIVLGLDFADALNKSSASDTTVRWRESRTEFLDRLSLDFKLENNPYRWQAHAGDLYSALLSLDALSDSFTTISTQANAGTNRTAQGFNPAQDYAQVVRHEGAWVLFQQKLPVVQERFSRPGLGIFSTQNRWSLELEGIKRVLQEAGKKGIQVSLFLNPYHYTYLEAIQNGGYWDEFEDYKRSLRDLVDRYGQGRVALWDFALYAPYTVHPVPRKGKKEFDPWFWEPAHYREGLGDLMLKEMFGTECLVDQQHPAFGVRLDQVDMEKHLAQQRKLRLKLLP